MIKKECDFCNKEFEARRNTAKYCCNSCRTKSYMVRNGKGDGSLREGMGLMGLNNEKNLSTRTQKDIFGNDVEMDGATGKPKIEEKKGSKRTGQDVFVDAGIGIGTTLLGNRLDNFFRSRGNRQTQKKDLSYVLKVVHHWIKETKTEIRNEIWEIQEQIKELQNKKKY